MTYVNVNKDKRHGLWLTIAKEYDKYAGCNTFYINVGVAWRGTVIAHAFLCIHGKRDKK